MTQLQNIEEKTQTLIKWNQTSEPDWIKGVPIDGIPDDEIGHISGQLRELSDELWDINRQLAITLGEAADKFDDAHEYWLDNECEILKAHLDSLIAGSTF